MTQIWSFNFIVLPNELADPEKATSRVRHSDDSYQCFSSKKLADKSCLLLKPVATS
jgi:hypothetical protein